MIEGFEPLERPHNPAMDRLINEPKRILDHGFVRVVDYMGDEAAIVQAARVSYGKGTTNVSDDVALIRYLIRHRHTSPLEQCSLKLHCSMPIFVAAQWIRHRTAKTNQISARYSILERKFYIPAEDTLGEQSKSNKQGRGTLVTPEQAAIIQRAMEDHAANSYDFYTMLLNDDGEGNPEYEGAPMLARELARMNLPQNIYTSWYWKIDLHNLLHFLSLRAHPHAQYEIRVYAEEIMRMVREWVPSVAQAFEDYHPSRGAYTFSRQETALLIDVLHGAAPNPMQLEEWDRRDLFDRYDIGSKRERIAFYRRLADRA